MRVAAAFLSLISMAVAFFALISGVTMAFNLDKEVSALLEDQDDSTTTGTDEVITETDFTK